MHTRLEKDLFPLVCQTFFFFKDKIAFQNHIKRIPANFIFEMTEFLNELYKAYDFDQQHES